MAAKVAKTSARAATPRSTAKRPRVRSVKPRTSVATKLPDPMTPADRIDQRIASLGDWRGERLAEVRRLIREAGPAVVEEWKWMGTPTWSHHGIVAVANAHKDKVKVTFAHGAALPDPAKVFNAGLGGNQWRAIDIHEGDGIDAAAFKALLCRAVAYNVERSAAPRKAGRA